MKPMFRLLAALMLTVIAASAAKTKFNQPSKEQLEREAKQKEREKAAKIVQAYLDRKDTNHDGSLSLDEFLVGEADVAAATAKFNKANKNGDRYLMKDEIADMLGL